jgi:hypothetical protein
MAHALLRNLTMRRTAHSGTLVAMTKAVIVAWLLSCAGCGLDASSMAVQAVTASESCKNRPGSGSDFDARAGNWRRLVAPHGIGTNGSPKPVDAMLVTCESVVSLAHDQRPDSKANPPDKSELLWSRDGREWELRKLTTTGVLDDIAWGADTWVAVGGHPAGVIMMSKQADASSWHEVFESTQWPFSAVAFGAGVFVAVATDAVAVSADGEHWHWAHLPAEQALYYDVAFGAGRFVVAGVGATLNSTDGETWLESSCDTCSPIQTPSGPAEAKIALQEMHHAGNAFYAFGASGELTSRDGVTFVPFDRARVPDVRIGDTLLNVTTSSPVPGSDGLFASVDKGASWSQLPLQPDVSTADCSTELCVVADRGVLTFDLDR